jgi:simple sugar transport system ATP-binding protein
MFGHVRALDNANFDLYPGEVAALIGDNGAGKSTLIKALSGNLDIDSGEILFDGKEVNLTDPAQARAMGIETVYQDLALAPHLDPVENMYLGREIMHDGLAGILGFMKTRQMRMESRAAFDELGAPVRSLTSPVGSMSGGQRQAIAIARAVSWANRVVFLDEPQGSRQGRGCRVHQPRDAPSHGGLGPHPGFASGDESGHASGVTNLDGRASQLNDRRDR